MGWLRVVGDSAIVKGTTSRTADGIGTIDTLERAA